MSIGFSNPARNDLARVFLFTKGVFKCNEPGDFAACVSVDALSQDRGDVTKIECPSPYKYGEFLEVFNIPGEVSRMTTTLSGRLSRSEASLFYDLFNKNCSFDMHLHFGLCQQPNAFNQYDKAMVFEDVQVTSFSTDPLVALQSGDRAVINESIDISIGRFYEIVNLDYSQRANNLTVNGPIVAVEICDMMSCGSYCDDTSDGCQRLYAVSADGFIYYSNDGGISWAGVLIQTAGGANPTPVLDLVCWGEYILVLDDTNQVWAINRDDLGDNVWTVNTTAITTAANAAATSMSNVGIFVGDGGQVALVTDLEGGTTLIDAGFTTTEDLNDVYISASGFVVAVGDNGTVIYSSDGATWYTTPATPTGNDLSAVVVKSGRNWIVGDVNGGLWCTDDAGATWARISYPGWAGITDEVTDLDLATNHVLYASIGDRVLRTTDGGATWVVEPNSKRNFPANAGIASVAACYWNPNFVVVGGESVGGTGFIATGTPVSSGTLFGVPNN